MVYPKSSDLGIGFVLMAFASGEKRATYSIDGTVLGSVTKNI